MKKTKFLAIPVLAALLLAGCADAPQETNKAPTVTGVKDIKCMVNSTVDFLDGVAALDKEDGDITPKMKISVTPNVEVSEGGYGYFTEVGEYIVNYSVADSEGRTAQKRAYVNVVDREPYKTFAMPEGFTAEADGSAKIEKCGMIDSEFVLKATGGEIAEDIRLTRTYTLNTNLQYTFRYTVNSKTAGKVKVQADGYDCGEIAVKEGENIISFAHTARKEKDEETKSVKIDLCLGNLGEVDLKLLKVGCEYPQNAGELVERVPDFNFGGRVDGRFDDKGGEYKLVANAFSTDDGSAAKLEITETTLPAGDIWRGGMFINTGVNTRLGVTYTVSFKIEREKQENCEVVIQRGQWDEDKFEILRDIEDGTISYTMTVNDRAHVGALWIYIQAGSSVNNITVSELSIKEHLEPVGVDEYAIEDFTESHDKAFSSEFSSDRGSFTYEISSFSAKDSDHTVKSPSFYIAGSGSNYVISFKAKASKPVEIIVAGPVAGGWDPTLMWSRITLSEEETVYSFKCNGGKAADRLYTIVWQFGSAVNQKYEDVKIEISDIKVSLKNNELDG